MLRECPQENHNCAPPHRTSDKIRSLPPFGLRTFVSTGPVRAFIETHWSWPPACTQGLLDNRLVLIAEKNAELRPVGKRNILAMRLRGAFPYGTNSRPNLSSERPAPTKVLAPRVSVEPNQWLVVPNRNLVDASRLAAEPGTSTKPGFGQLGPTRNRWEPNLVGSSPSSVDASHTPVEREPGSERFEPDWGKPSPHTYTLTRTSKRTEPFLSS